MFPLEIKNIVLKRIYFSDIDLSLPKPIEIPNFGWNELKIPWQNESDDMKIWIIKFISINL